MGIIATGLQTRNKDDYAPSTRLHLVLRTNAEEKTSVISNTGGPPVPAGFDAPTVTPTGVVGAGGTLSGYYVYCYVYASSKYPYVENAVPAANGELWPRSNPSPMSAVQDASAGSKTVTLTLTKTTRSDVDKILVYRTESSTTSAEAQALADAGTLYYVATAANNGVAGTVVVSDTGITDTGEALELDNYPAPTAAWCEFDGTYFWITGNPPYSAEVTLDGTSTVTITDGDSVFNGRDGQFATFDGVSTGGFDNAGTFYAKITASDTVVLYADADLTTPMAIAFTGTTTMQLAGLQNILWRSKPLNPFSWGITEQVVDASGQSVAPVPETFVLNLGGGSVTGLAISPNGKRIILHFENPQQTTAGDLEFAESETFGQTFQILDKTGSVTCNFTIFEGYWGNNPVLFGLDTYNGNILITDGYQQHTVADNFWTFIQSLPKPDRSTLFFHGQYDPGTQLNCIWVRLYDTDERNNIKLWVHGPTQMCGWTPDFDLLSSATVLDSTTNERFLIGGTELGFMGRILDPSTFFNWNFIYGWDIVLNTTSTTFLLGWNAQYGSQNFITQTNPATGVFRVSSLNICAGQEIVLLLDIDSSITTHTVASIEKISDSLWEVTLDAPYPATANNYTVSAHPKYYGREWMVQTNCPFGGTGFSEMFFVKSAFNSFSGGRPLFDLEYSLEVGSEDFGDVVPVPANTFCYLGGIPTTFRTYFDLGSPAINKVQKEVWMTMDQHGGDVYSTITQTLPAVRFYVQFSETIQTQIKLEQDTLPSGLTEQPLAFFNRTEVPSWLLKEFGIEFIECGQNDCTLYNWTLFLRQTEVAKE